MAHNRVIIIGSIQTRIAESLTEDEANQWNALLDAVNATEDLLTAFGTPQALKTKIHNKQHELQEFLEAGAPFDMEQVEDFTDDLNDLL